MQKYMILLNGGYNPFVQHGRGGLGYRPMRQMIGGMIKGDEYDSDFETEISDGGGETRLVSYTKPYRNEDAQLVHVSNTPSNEDDIEEQEKKEQEKKILTKFSNIGSHMLREEMKQKRENRERNRERIDEIKYNIIDLRQKKLLDKMMSISKHMRHMRFNEIIGQIEKKYMKSNSNRGIAFEHWVVENSNPIITALNKIIKYDPNFSDIIFSPINKIKQYEDISDGKYKKILTKSIDRITNKFKSIAEFFPIDLYGKNIAFECKYFIDKTSDLIYIQDTKIIGYDSCEIRYINHNGRYKYYGVYCFDRRCDGWVVNENEKLSDSGKEYYLIVLLNDGIYIKNLIIQEDIVFAEIENVKTKSGKQLYKINQQMYLINEQTNKLNEKYKAGYKTKYNTKYENLYGERSVNCLEFKKSELIRLPI